MQALLCVFDVVDYIYWSFMRFRAASRHCFRQGFVIRYSQQLYSALLYNQSPIIRIDFYGNTFLHNRSYKMVSVYHDNSRRSTEQYRKKDPGDSNVNHRGKSTCKLGQLFEMPTRRCDGLIGSSKYFSKRWLHRPAFTDKSLTAYD